MKKNIIIALAILVFASDNVNAKSKSQEIEIEANEIAFINNSYRTISVFAQNVYGELENKFTIDPAPKQGHIVPAWKIATFDPTDVIIIKNSDENKKQGDKDFNFSIANWSQHTGQSPSLNLITFDNKYPYTDPHEVPVYTKRKHAKIRLTFDNKDSLVYVTPID